MPDRLPIVVRFYTGRRPRRRVWERGRGEGGDSRDHGQEGGGACFASLYDGKAFAWLNGIKMCR